MNHRRRMTPVRLGLAAGLALFLGAGPGSAQEDAEAAQRAQELIGRIRASMREIDKILLGASDPVRAAEQAEQAARDLEELLDEAESKSRSVMASLDELIEMAKPPQKSSQSQQQQGEGQPKPENSGNQRGRSQDPDQLQRQGDPQQQEQEGQQDQGEQDRPGQPDKDPRGKTPDNSDPNQRDADRPPPDAATGEFERADTSGRWGLLPPKEAELLLRHNIEEFPLRYRHWMNLYYKRVNSAEDR